MSGASVNGDLNGSQILKGPINQQNQFNLIKSLLSQNTR